MNWISCDDHNDPDAGEKTPTDIGYDRTLEETGEVVHYVEKSGLAVVSISAPAADVVLDGINTTYYGGIVYFERYDKSSTYDEPPGGPGPAVGNDCGIKIINGSRARLRRCGIYASNAAWHIRQRPEHVRDGMQLQV